MIHVSLKVHTLTGIATAVLHLGDAARVCRAVRLPSPRRGPCRLATAHHTLHDQWDTRDLQGECPTDGLVEDAALIRTHHCCFDRGNLRCCELADVGTTSDVLWL